MFSASGVVDREDWGLTWNMPVPTGGLLVSRRIRIEIEVELIRELRAEMIRQQARIDQIAAAAHDRADEITILRARLMELQCRSDARRGVPRRHPARGAATAGG